MDDDAIYTVVDSFQKGVSFDSNLAAGLEYVLENVFTEEMGSRATATKILVVLTDNLPMLQVNILKKLFLSSNMKNEKLFELKTFYSFFLFYCIINL